MADESIEVAPSEESGNVPAEEIAPVAPNVPTETETPAATTEETSEAPAVELFDLPDGRKVDAVTLTKEWKENFLPDYTRKSQALAAKDAPKVETLQEKPTTDPLLDPNYVPQTYAELAEQIEARTLQKIEATERARIEAQQARETMIETQLNEVKTSDPTVNENALFLHATKYKFTDLRVAHQNMKDMAEVAKKVKTATAADIQKRNDPVSIKPGGTGTKPNPSAFGSAVEYMRSLK